MSATISLFREPAKPALADAPVKIECQHYWVIETPNGSVSVGVCKFCREERHFNNSAERYVIKKRGG